MCLVVVVVLSPQFGIFRVILTEFLRSMSPEEIPDKATLPNVPSFPFARADLPQVLHVPFLGCIAAVLPVRLLYLFSKTPTGPTLQQHDKIQNPKSLRIPESKPYPPPKVNVISPKVTAIFPKINVKYLLGIWKNLNQSRKCAINKFWTKNPRELLG